MTDEELLQEYQRGKDQEWIGVLLQRYTLLLLGVCMKYLKDENEAREAVQQIFLKVLSDVSKYEIKHFKSWLYMVAKNHCFMLFRQKNSRGFIELGQDLKDEPGFEINGELLKSELAHDLLEPAINELREEQRQCVILFYLKRNSYQQICEKTGYDIKEVKSFIQNGRRNLKLIIEKKIKELNRS